MRLKPTLWIFVLLFIFSVAAQAHEYVQPHELNCTKEFPCYPELKPRIEFWIEVFSHYRNDQAIFHDNEVPHRVYAVVDGLSCSGKSRGEQRKVEQERTKWKGILQDVAQKIESQATNWTPHEEHVVHLFDEPSGDDLREASGNVRCQQGNKDRFAHGLARYGAYREMILEALRKEDLAEDIQYLPFVESAFNPQAYSRVGAAGLWQIMPGTARRLGLKMGIQADERLDPYHASKAAARYLKSAYKTLKEVPQPRKSSGDQALGPFVITSYNYGTEGMKKALKHFGPDFVKVLHEYEGRRFRTAVRNFYVSFLAARHVAMHASRYFPEVSLLSPISFATLELSRATSAGRLQEVLGISQSHLKDLNPGLTRWVWQDDFLIPKGHEVKIPKGVDPTQLTAKLEALPPESDPWRDRVEYRVRRGDVPCQIARTFGVDCQKLMALNGIGRRGMIRVGQKIQIPPRPGREAKETVVAMVTPTPLPTAMPLLRPTTTPEIAVSPPPATPTPEITVAFGPPLAAPTPSPPVELISSAETDQYEVKTKNGAYFIQVDVEETLGHYADWLDLGFASPIRKLNKWPFGKPLQLGQKIFLPIQNEEQRKSFETRRTDYHRAMEAEFLGVFEIESTQAHQVQRGDTIWSLSRQFQIPQWLLRRENLAIFDRGLRPGDSLSIPVLKSLRGEETNGVLQLEP